ncbi:MAG: hypothetical protein AAFY19_06015, partial [Pseudomonadota bacterium]
MKTLCVSMTTLVAAIAPLAPVSPTFAQEAQGMEAAAFATSPRDDVMTAKQVREELAITRKALEEIHPGYTRYTSKAALGALWDDVEAKALAHPTRGEMYLQISRVLAAIRCDHTKAELPGDFEEARKAEPVYLPLRYVIFDGRMFVTNPGETGLVRGAEIVAIDARPVGEVIEAVKALFPVDGDTDFIKDRSISQFG